MKKLIFGLLGLSLLLSTAAFPVDKNEAPGPVKFMASAIGTAAFGYATYKLFVPTVKCTALAAVGIIGGTVGTIATQDPAALVIVGGLASIPAAILIPANIACGFATYCFAQPLWRTVKYVFKRN